MYIWWQKENQIQSRALKNVLEDKSKKIERFIRKQIHKTIFYSKRLIYKIIEKIARIIVKLFPKSEVLIIRKPIIPNEKPSHHLIYLSKTEKTEKDF